MKKFFIISGLIVILISCGKIENSPLLSADYLKNLKENQYIIFGHWAALDGKTNLDNVIGLDTGCVWGGKLTIMRLEDNKKYYIKKIKK